MRQRSFYFSDGQYLEILQSLCHELTKTEAFVQLMGGARSGKSALCETLALFLTRKGYEVIYIDYPIESPEMLRGVLAQEFNLPNDNNVSRQLEDSLSASFEKSKLLIFDDAHRLSDMTLLEIHRMAEIQVGSKRVLNVLLCGEPELDARLLNKKELQSLVLNVSRKYLLRPMDIETLSQFFLSYVAKSESVGLQLADDALDLFYASSKGYPGPATSLCELIVHSTKANTGQQVITKVELAELIRNSHIQQALPAAELINVSQLKVLVPIAAVFSIAAIGFVFQMISSEDETILDQAALDLNANDSPFAESPGGLAVQQDIVSPDSTGAQAGSATSSSVADLALVVDQNSSEGARPVATQLESMPALLRPASVFSLDDEEYDQPASDSALALVTAAEIGVLPEAIAEPDPLVIINNESLVATPDAEIETLAQESVVIATVEDAGSNSALISAVGTQDNVESAGVSAVRLIVAEETVLDVSQDVPLVELAPEVFELETAGQSDVVEVGLTEAVEITEVTEGIAVNEDSAVLIASEPSAASGADAVSDSVAVAEVNQVQPDQELSIEVLVRRRVDSWVSAWEQQQLEGYFASYSSEFVPRYESNVARWRASRTRVIGNAQWIRLTLTEYEVIEQSPDSIEVHFWLDYESPTYGDSTKKKLVLNNVNNSWMILEEINLEVRS